MIPRQPRPTHFPHTTPFRSLTVTPVNDAPTASASPASPTLAEDSQATVTLAGSDPETAAADLQFKITALPTHGTLSKDDTSLLHSRHHHVCPPLVEDIFHPN